MSRYDIALGKKTKPSTGRNYPKYSPPPGQISEGPKSMNFSLNGPGGFRLIIPVNNLTINLEGDVLSVTNGRDVNIRLTGSLAYQMYEDLRGRQEERGLTRSGMSRPVPTPPPRRGRTIVI